MEPISVAFAMTDAVMAAAIREHLRALGRDWFRPGNLAWVAASGVAAGVGFANGSAWFGWLAAAPAAVFAALFAGWLGAWWWLPRSGVRKLGHLPHRRVTVECSDEKLAFATANERLEVAWCEVTQIRRLPGHWLFCLRAGAKIPVPAALLRDDAVAALRARAAAR